MFECSKAIIEYHETHWVFKEEYKKYIIGRSGRKLKQIEKQSGAIIKPLGNSSVDFVVACDEELFCITGSREATEAAIFLRYAPAPHLPLQQHQTTATV